MGNIFNRAAFIAGVSCLAVLAVNDLSYCGNIASNHLLVGRNPKYNCNVYLHKDSIVDHKEFVRTAIFCLNIDKITEEYSARYNCSSKTMQLFKLVVKDGDTVLGQKDLFITEKTDKNSIDGKILDTVCHYTINKH